MGNGQSSDHKPLMMRIQVEDDQFDTRLVVCSVHGRILRNALDEDESPEDQLLGPAAFAKTILLDLSATDELDSVGVSWLIRFHKRCEKAHGRLIIHSMPPAICRSFELLNMGAIFLLAGDEQTARELAMSNSS